MVDEKYLLEKFQGKGGWTYARIPQILQDKSSPFGWVRVRGSIDDYEIKSYHLMPMGNGNLFLPVKAAIRKKIGKKEGDFVHITLYKDNLPVEIPEELQTCLMDEPAVYKNFHLLFMMKTGWSFSVLYGVRCGSKRRQNIKLFAIRHTTSRG